MKGKQITISKEEYLYLLMRDEKLNNLELSGVDNWDGCSSDLCSYDYQEEYEEFLQNKK